MKCAATMWPNMPLAPRINTFMDTDSFPAGARFSRDAVSGRPEDTFALLPPQGRFASSLSSIQDTVIEDTAVDAQFDARPGVSERRRPSRLFQRAPEPNTIEQDMIFRLSRHD